MKPSDISVCDTSLGAVADVTPQRLSVVGSRVPAVGATLSSCWNFAG